MQDVFEQKEKAVVGLLATTSLLLTEAQSQNFDSIDERLADREGFIRTIQKLDKKIGSNVGPSDHRIVTLLKEAEEQGQKAQAILEEHSRYFRKVLETTSRSKNHLIQTHMISAKGQRLDARG